MIFRDVCLCQPLLQIGRSLRDGFIKPTKAVQKNVCRDGLLYKVPLKKGGDVVVMGGEFFFVCPRLLVLICIAYVGDVPKKQ